MGHCQSKKDAKTPTNIKHRDQKNTRQQPKPSQETSKEIDQDQSFISSPRHPSEKDLLLILEAAYTGNLSQFNSLIETHKIQDISDVSGYKQHVKVGNESYEKKYINTAIWNPLLLAIAGKQHTIVKCIFEKIDSFHQTNCLSKPITIDKQKHIEYDHQKRIRRESFALKLSIKNMDRETFKFLWNENRLLWNLGHFFQCLNKIITYGWDQGLKILMASTTTKIIFMSINEVSDFVDCIDLIRQEIQISEKTNQKLGKKFLDYLKTRPYFIYSLFYEIASFTHKPDREHLEQCLSKLVQDDIQFLHKQLEEIFLQLDDTQVLESFKNKMLSRFENNDQQIINYLKKLEREFEKPEVNDTDENQKILEELDLFGFRTITVQKMATNALLQALKRGFMKMVFYCFSKETGFINLRSIIRLNNKFEVQNDIAVLQVDFFNTHIGNQKFFEMIYYNLIDILQLSNFLEILDDISQKRNIEIIDFILKDTKFQSLFISSLELQKYLFMNEAKQILSKPGFDQLMAILKSYPYSNYFKDVNQGNNGKAYTQKTLAHLDKLDQRKDDLKKKRQKLMITRGSGLIEFHSLEVDSALKARKSNIHQIQDLQQHLTSIVERQESEQSDRIRTMQDNKDSNLTLKRPSEMHIEEEKQQKKSQFFDMKESGTRLQVTPTLKDSNINNSRMITENQDENVKLSMAKPKEEVKALPPLKDSKRKKNQYQESQQHDQDQTKQGNNTPSRNRQLIKMPYQDSHMIHARSTIESNFEVNLDKQEEQLNFMQSLKREQINEKPKQMSQLDQKPNKDKNSKSSERRSKQRKRDQDEDDDDDIDQDIASADASYEDKKLSQRIPNVLEKKIGEFKGNSMQEMQSPRANAKNYEKLPGLILETIKNNKIQELKYYLAKFSIKNVTWMKHMELDESLKVKGKDFDQISNQSKNSQNLREKLDPPTYDVSMWNPILYAIYYQRAEIVKLLLDNYSASFTMAIRLPPVNEFTEYIIPGQKPLVEQWANRRINQQNIESDTSYHSPQKSQYTIPYNPSDARVECFGLELAIRNKDIATLVYLWEQQAGLWEERHFAFVLDKVLQEHWDLGIGKIFRANTSHIIFKALNPEDKDNFLFSKIIDKITDTEYWEREQMLEYGSKPTQITEQQVKIVIEELKNFPYGNYAVLKYPNLFEKYALLEETLSKVRHDDIYDYVIARKENIRHLNDYITQYQNSKNKSKQALQNLLSIQKQAQQIEGAQRKTPLDPKQIIQIIKLGDLNKLKEYFANPDNQMFLDLLNQLQGHMDNDYQKMYQSNVKYIPSDETIQLLLADNSTYEWNPLIFAIFYQRKEMVEYFCENKRVYARNCLTTPFIIEVDEDAEDLDEEKFIKEKSEMFCLVMCIMLQNRDIFKYLWKKCSFMWNDIHFVALVNFIFESHWLDGIRILFASATTHQIFNAMNMYEKEKFLKFCEKSISKQNPVAIKDFRYQMSFDPYNIYYLPIMATREDLIAWDKDEVSKELFIKNCNLNFDERSFAILSKLNSHYVSEFISTAEGNSSEMIQNFVRKLRRYKGLTQ